MRSHSDLIAELGSLANVEQGSDEWLLMRCGVATASKAKEFTAKRDSQTYKTYLRQKAHEVISGQLKDQVTAKSLDWGKSNEDAARELYQFETGNVVLEVPFIYRDSDKRFGCSPDGLIDPSSGLELKCPIDGAVFIAFVTDEQVKKEYEIQCQFGMWVSDCDTWQFANYDPRVRGKNLHHIEFKKSDEHFRAFDSRAEEWISDMEIILDKFGVKYGEQFTYI